jgi:hypothetical protein
MAGRWLPQTGWQELTPTPKPISVPETIPDPKPLLYDATGTPLTLPSKQPVGFRAERPSEAPDAGRGESR